MKIKQFITERCMGQRKNQERIKNFLNKWKNRHNITKLLGHIVSSPMKEIYSSRYLHSKIGRRTNKWLNDVTKNLENLEQTISHQQEIIIIRAKINKIETKIK